LYHRPTCVVRTSCLSPPPARPPILPPFPYTTLFRSRQHRQQLDRPRQRFEIAHRESKERHDRRGFEYTKTGGTEPATEQPDHDRDRKSTRLNSSHSQISYAVFCLKKKKKKHTGYEEK